MNANAQGLNINALLEEIGDAVLTCINYRPYPVSRLDAVIKQIEDLRTNPSYLRQCEEHLRSAGSNYVLFFLSNIIYNLKKQGELVLTPDVLKWLGSVWINFLKRNRSYQDMFPVIHDFRIKFKKYYPGEGTFINQISNVTMVREDYIIEGEGDNEAEDTPLRNLEKFHQVTSEILTAMKPTYFFLLDFYYERKMNAGIDSPEAIQLEAGGLAKFGHRGYTYADLALLVTQALGILEAVYLILKKKKAQRRLINIDGKQKFLTTPEIYAAYLEKFTAMKKELSGLNK